MTCHGCRRLLVDGGWFFIDAPPWKKLALCEPCHQDSVPSKSRREWRGVDAGPRWVGGSLGRPSRMNTKTCG